ncbi:hypothetical protein M758_UG037300 [Ceratodon purpureus]|nr:hypothetical protein M758_UG037300 [Ceratodon purpureus]
MLHCGSVPTVYHNFIIEGSTSGAGQMSGLKQRVRTMEGALEGSDRCRAIKERPHYNNGGNIAPKEKAVSNFNNVKKGRPEIMNGTKTSERTNQTHGGCNSLQTLSDHAN